MSAPASEQRIQTARSGLLLASLQRAYQSEDGASTHAPVHEWSGSGGKPTCQPTRIGSGLHSMEVVCDSSELDPLPFVSHRNDSAGAKWMTPSLDTCLHDPSPPASSETTAQRGVAAPSPSPGGAAESADRTAPVERRKLPRRESECSVLICPYKGNDRPAPARIAWMLHAAKSRGHLLDVSMSGVALSLTEQIAPGTRVVLRISNQALNKQVDASATVLRCREEGGGWSVVCRFDKNLTFEQIHLIGRSLFASTIV